MKVEAYLKILIDLLSKKHEALTYLCDILEDEELVKQSYFENWYFSQKKELESAVLEADRAFLEAYRELLETESIEEIKQLPDEYNENVKALEGKINEVQNVEAKLMNLERLVNKTQ
jgi:hypothetical protein